EFLRFFDARVKASLKLRVQTGTLRPGNHRAGLGQSHGSQVSRILARRHRFGYPIDLTDRLSKTLDHLGAGFDSPFRLLSLLKSNTLVDECSGDWLSKGQVLW